MSGAIGMTSGYAEQGRTSRMLAVALILLLAVLLPAAAFGASATVRVFAAIKPWLKFSAVPQVEFYQVDAAALRRGYVDIPSSLAVELSTNVRDEVLLDLNSAGPETIQVLDGGAAPSAVLRFAAVANNVPVARQFGLRVLLPPGLDEGTYPLRLQVSAAML